GLTAAIYAKRALLKTLIFEKDLAGGKLNKTADVENYPDEEVTQLTRDKQGNFAATFNVGDNLLLLASLGGFPSLSLPIGFVNGLPVSINANTAYQQDNLLLQLGELLEEKLL
ncbi:21525_t:CDS:2, partial [Entrophospora sp. SA101]